MRPTLLCVALAAVGCTSTQTVQRRELLPLSGGDRDAGASLDATGVLDARIDPNTRIRFQRADGEYSRSYSARELLVNERGVFVREAVPLAGNVDRARVAGLGWGESRDLAATRGDGGELFDLGDNTFELRGEPDALAAWIARWIVAVGSDDRPSAVTRVCRSSLTGELRLAPVVPVGDDECRDGTAEELARARLAARGGRGLGRWWFHFGDAGWHGEATNGELLEVLDGGVSIRVGWAWADISAAEVTNISGGKTFAAIVATTAIAVALAPLAMLYRGGGVVKQSTGDGGGGGGGSGGGGSGGSGWSSAGRVLGGGGNGKRDDGTWAPTLIGAKNAPATHLFDGRTRRRSIARLFVLGDVAADLRRPDALVDGVAAGLRFVDLVEIGGGVRHLLAETEDGALHNSTAGFFRLGLHLPLDSSHRFAIPLSFDVGGGGDVSYFRFNLGLRMRVSKNWFAGAFLFNPTRTRYHQSSPAAGRKRWSYASGLELGVAF